LAATWTGIVVSIQGLFKLAEKNVASGNLFCSQHTGGNSVEAKYVFPSNFVAGCLRCVSLTIVFEA
jgi:hypothetical protein